jgi:hypothetical protein
MGQYNKQEEMIMFTHDEMRFLRNCSENEIMDEIIHKMTLVNCNRRPVTEKGTKPQVLVIIDSDNNFKVKSTVDLDLTVSHHKDSKVITPEEFEAATQVEYERFLLYKAKEKRAKALKEVRIFIHDEKDLFPYNVQIEGNVIATCKTFNKALEVLNSYVEAWSK